MRILTGISWIIATLLAPNWVFNQIDKTSNHSYGD